MKPLTSPPIIEALIDLQFSKEISAQDARVHLDRIYGSRGTINELLEHRFDVGEGGTSTSTTNTGASVKDFGQTSALIQLKRKSLTFNQLSPYPGWGEFEGWARAATVELGDALQGRSVTRIAARFINRIAIEDLASKISRYVRLFPVNHFGPGTQMHGFVTKLNVGWPPYFGNVTLATPQGSLSEIVIDIEVFRQIDAVGLEGVLVDWDAIMPDLRKRKNDAFEAIVSQELLDEFK